MDMTFPESKASESIRTEEQLEADKIYDELLVTLDGHLLSKEFKGMDGLFSMEDDETIATRDHLYDELEE